MKLSGVCVYLTGFEQDLGGLLLHSVSGRLQLTLRLPLSDFHYLRVLSHLLQLFMQILRKHARKSIRITTETPHTNLSRFVIEPLSLYLTIFVSLSLSLRSLFPFLLLSHRLLCSQIHPH